MEINKIYLGDCLGLMKDIDDKSIDIINERIKNYEINN